VPWAGGQTGREGHCGRGLRTFNGRVIFVDEVALDKLDGQTTLSDTTAADYHELVFPEELQRFTVSRDLGGWWARQRCTVAQGAEPLASTGGGRWSSMHTFDAIAREANVQQETRG